MANCKQHRPQTGVLVHSILERYLKSHRFSQPSQLKNEKSYEIALINLLAYKSIPNIHASHNSSRYSLAMVPTGFPSHLAHIPMINKKILRKLQLTNIKVKIIIDANLATLRAKLTLARHYQTDFNVANSKNTVLGLKRQIYTFNMTTDGYTEGEQTMNITSINNILVQSDIIHRSYVNGTQ